MDSSRLRATLLLFFCACSLWRPSTALAQSTPVFQAETHLVTLTFSARDSSGRFVDQMSRDDFAIYEDGMPQKISLFSRESELPLTLGIVVDASESQKKFVHQHLKDIHTFLASILRPQDQAFALCFGDHLRLVTDLTADPSAISDGLKRFDKGSRNFPELEPDDTRSGGSAVYDAIYASIQEKLVKAPNHRRALILFTDGEENSSAHDEIETIAEAQGADVLIYAIRYTEMKKHHLTADNRHGIAGLKHITEQTGGRDFDALKEDIPQTFRQIGDELRSVYSVGYYSTNKRHDDTFRKVVIETQSESHTDGITIRAKAGYYAR
ncbi:MAG TPA: VWA domain-containing protein [Acidobacteriaceae bacterium]